ncbi:MAG: hypothetical protein ABSC26_09655 [Stellaceae bacterium]|jgi:hypothetical protein
MAGSRQSMEKNNGPDNVNHHANFFCAECNHHGHPALHNFKAHRTIEMVDNIGCPVIDLGRHYSAVDTRIRALAQSSPD